MAPARITIPIAHEADISSARVKVGKMADRVGLGKNKKLSIITSISELAQNILDHAGRGEITMRIVTRDDGNKGVEVEAVDRGPGIANIELAMRDGYSTTGSLGGGLGGVSRMMSEMEIFSLVGKGTIVRAVKWVDEARSVPLSSEGGTFSTDPSVSSRPALGHDHGSGEPP